MKRVNPTLWGANYGHVHLKATSQGLHTTRQNLCAYFKKQCAKKIALSYTFTKLNQATNLPAQKPATDIFASLLFALIN
jgi:hypothetical protein